MSISRAELARQLGVSRTYITLLAQGKRKPSQKIADKLAKLKLTANLGVNTCTHEQQTFNLLVAGSNPARLTNADISLPPLLLEFLASRRQGSSPRTLQFYKICLVPFLTKYALTPVGINQFLSNLNCRNGKHFSIRL